MGPLLRSKLGLRRSLYGAFRPRCWLDFCGFSEDGTRGESAEHSFHWRRVRRIFIRLSKTALVIACEGEKLKDNAEAQRTQRLAEAGEPKKFKSARVKEFKSAKLTTGELVWRLPRSLRSVPHKAQHSGRDDNC